MVAAKKEKKKEEEKSTRLRKSTAVQQGEKLIMYEGERESPQTKQTVWTLHSLITIGMLYHREQHSMSLTN